MLLRYAYLWMRHRRVKRFLADAKRARQIQRDVLFRKIRRNAESAFGREHGFAAMRSLEDFRRQLPIADYEYYRPYIDRVKQGETSAMFGPGTTLLMFALTSGTMSQSKYIPVTQEFFEEYRTGWNLWGLHTFRRHLDLVVKKTIQLTSDWQQFHTDSGTPCGNISGLAAETAPRISRSAFIIPHQLWKIRDPLAKQYAAMRLAMPCRKVGMIMTANPSTLVGFARLANERAEDLLRDMRNGTLASDWDVPQLVREAIRPRLRKIDAARIRELEQLVERNGTLYPRDYWPELTVLAVWTGGSVGVYLPRLKEYYGDTVFVDHGLSASEGRMTIPLEDGSSAGILDYISHYCEFVPEAEHGQENPTVLEAHELEEGQNYFILLTTSSGLYRYDIHDVVRCVGYHGTAPLLEFLNKGSLFSNITGEKISEHQAVEAVGKSFQELGIPIEQFTIAPLFGDSPGYVLLLEQCPNGPRKTRLAQTIDRHLAKANCEYANRLETNRLRPMQIRQIPAGTWARFRESRISRTGGSLEQYKHPCLTGDLEFINKLPI